MQDRQKTMHCFFFPFGDMAHVCPIKLLRTVQEVEVIDNPSTKDGKMKD